MSLGGRLLNEQQQKYCEEINYNTFYCKNVYGENAYRNGVVISIGYVFVVTYLIVRNRKRIWSYISNIKLTWWLENYKKWLIKDKTHSLILPGLIAVFFSLLNPLAFLILFIVSSFISFIVFNDRKK